MTALAKVIDVIHLINKLIINIEFSLAASHVEQVFHRRINLGQTYSLVCLNTSTNLITKHHPEVVLLSQVVFIDFQLFSPMLDIP